MSIPGPEGTGRATLGVASPADEKPPAGAPRRRENANRTPPSNGSLRIAVIPGDGIGPEVTREALKVLSSVARREAIGYTIREFPYGADHYIATGEILPDEAITELGAFDAILFGAVGDPRVPPRVLERGLLFALARQFRMDLSIRPYRLYRPSLSPLQAPEATGAVDGVIVREASEDVFALPGAALRRGHADEVSVGSVVFTRANVERAVRHGFELARARSRDLPHGSRGKLTVVDQSNAAEVYDIWPRTAHGIHRDYPDVELHHEAPDAFAMRFIKEPGDYDVIVTSWMLGGIFADLAAMVVGGLGLSGSARLSDHGPSLFEPTHGSAPKHAGRNVVSPVGAIEALRLMLVHLGYESAGGRITDAVSTLLSSGRIADVSTRGGVATTTQGDLVARAIEDAPT